METFSVQTHLQYSTETSSHTIGLHIPGYDMRV